MRVIIIGNGGAAIESIIAMRRGGYDSEIHLFSDSVFPAINPTLLTYYIADKIGMEDVFTCSGDFYKEYRVDLHMGSKVVKLDAVGKTVENAAGVKMSYDSCIVCSGASPVIPKEYQGKFVYTIRSVSGAIELKKGIATKKKALIAGASLIGLKVGETGCGRKNS